MQEAPARGAHQDGIACPSCGASAAADQMFCLECGERLALGYRRPPSWRLPAAIAGLVLLLAGAALAVALVQVTDEARRTASAPGATAPASPTGPPTRTGPAGGGEKPPRRAQPPASGEVRSWPARTSAYTVILLSTGTRAGAEGVARQAAQAGVPAGVLKSDDYSSLKPGFWVVFGGQFDSTEEAQREVERYAALGFAGGYARFVNGGG